MSVVQLATFDNRWYQPGRSVLWRSLWMFVGLPLFRSTWFPSSKGRAALLRLFGAQVGNGVVIRQQVTVKYPWHLFVGDHCWIGEQVWIDNLTTVRLGSDVCVSQGTYLCTGNHDWGDPGFGLRIAPIEMGDGAWAGAKSIMMPGVHLGKGAICTAGSVVSGVVADFHIVAGNPAKLVKIRSIHNQGSFAPSLEEVSR